MLRLQSSVQSSPNSKILAPEASRVQVEPNPTFGGNNNPSTNVGVNANPAPVTPPTQIHQDEYDVIVIGAGIAGLRAAQVLRRQNVKVLVVEASQRIGGRVKSDATFCPELPVELGAEILHGDNTGLIRLIQKCGWNVDEIFTWAHGDGGPRPDHPVHGATGFYYIGRDRKMLKADSKEADFCHLNEVLKSVDEVDISSVSDISFLDYLQQQKVTPRMIALAEAGYANTLCRPLKALPLHGTVAVERSWRNDGCHDFKFRGNLSQVVDYLAGGLTIVTDCPVKKVTWRSSSSSSPSPFVRPTGSRPSTPRGQTGVLSSVSSTGASAHSDSPPQMISPAPAGGFLSSFSTKDAAFPCTVTSVRGDVFRARKVIVAVPITILQDSDIEFSPPLPAEKLEAAKNIVMAPALKMVLRFSRRFWPREMQGIICSDGLVPEFWANQRDPQPSSHLDSSPLSQQPVYMLTAFSTASFASNLSNMTFMDRQEKVLQQLDQMFATEVDPHPASSSFMTMIVQDWTREPFIRGGYSAPSRESKCPGHDRRVVAEPVGRQIYFAGEYTEDNFSSMNAALDSGLKAGQRVLASMGHYHPRIQSKL